MLVCLRGFRYHGFNADFCVLEMWMGTYPDLPSYVLSSGKDLQEVLDANKEELIGEGVIKKFGHSDLPFLPKVST